MIRLHAMRRGVTLVEMLIVVSIIGLMAAVSFPSVTSGLDSIRLQSAADSVASFVNAAVNRAERRQEVTEIVIDPKANQLALYSTDPAYRRTLAMPQNVLIADGPEVRILLLPNGAPPRFNVDLANTRGAHKRVTMDPISGMSRISIPAATP